MARGSCGRCSSARAIPCCRYPIGDELRSALDELDLMVSLDIYRNETNAHADYILPATTMYERADFLLPFQALFTTPFKQAPMRSSARRGRRGRSGPSSTN